MKKVKFCLFLPFWQFGAVSLTNWIAVVPLVGKQDIFWNFDSEQLWAQSLQGLVMMNSSAKPKSLQQVCTNHWKSTSEIGHNQEQPVLHESVGNHMVQLWLHGLSHRLIWNTWSKVSASLALPTSRTFSEMPACFSQLICWNLEKNPKHKP